MFEQLERRDLLAVTVDNLHLVADTGPSNSDLVTSDPRIAGVVNGDFWGRMADVQFDHNQDGVVDGTVTAFGPGMSFQYDPRVTQPSLNSYAGTLPLRWRTVEYNAQHQVLATGSWTSFSFTLQPDPSAGPEISVDQDGTDIPDNTGDVDFGSATVGGSILRTFTVHNIGADTLLLNTSSLQLPGGFTVTQTFNNAIGPQGTTQIPVQFQPNSVGTFSGTFSIGTNDADENPFNFTIHGVATSSSGGGGGGGSGGGSGGASLPVVSHPVSDQTMTEDDQPRLIDVSDVFSTANPMAGALTLTVHDNSAPGVVEASLVSGVLSLILPANANGTATITLRATDQIGGYAEDQFVVNVAPINDAPAPGVDLYSVIHDVVLTTSATTGVLANDLDVDGDALKSPMVWRSVNPRA